MIIKNQKIKVVSWQATTCGLYHNLFTVVTRSPNSLKQYICFLPLLIFTILISMASIVRDDPQSHIVTGGGSWSTVAMARFFGGSATWPAFATFPDFPQGDTGNYGSLSMQFQGTSVTFFGNTPSLPASQWVLVSIDGGIQYNSSFMDPAPPSSRQWLKSPTLPDGTHSIDISHIAGTSVDFVVITAGQNTPLSGEKLIVDDGDPSITYAGSWTLNTNTYTSRDNPHTGLPYGNGTRQTTSTGASATFHFNGNSVALYGIFTFNVFGTISVTYTIDGFPVTRTYSVDATTPEFTRGVLQLENYSLHSNDSLSSGDHTLQIQVINCVNKVFNLDYITYSPSFLTLASKPNIPGPSPGLQSGSPSPIPSNGGSPNPLSSGGNSPNPLSSGGSSPNPLSSGGSSTNFLSSFQPANQTGSATELQTGSLSSLRSPSTPTPGIQKNVGASSPPRPIAAIVGGVSGGVVFLILLFLLGRRIFKRHTILRSTATEVLKDGLGPSSIQPFLLSASNMGMTAETGTEATTGSAISPQQRKAVADEGETDRLTGAQMQRFQVLIQNFNREISASSLPGGRNPGFDSARIAELHGHIADLMNENTEHRNINEGSSSVNPARALPPPAYEEAGTEEQQYSEPRNS